MFYIGIDLGTSTAKLLLVDEEGQVRKIVTRPSWDIILGVLIFDKLVDLGSARGNFDRRTRRPW